MEYASVLDKFYKSFNPGMIQQHHAFRVESTTCSTAFMEVYHDVQDIISQQLINNKGNSRYNDLLIADAPLLPWPGIKPIKYVELYKKWRPFVPHQFREEICPRPSDEVIASVKMIGIIRLGRG
jgi:hypothetical protein